VSDQQPPVPPIEQNVTVVPPAPPVPPIDPYALSASAVVPAYQAPGYAYNGYGQPPPPKGLAIASLVTGIAGAFFSLFYGFGLFPSIAGIITGHLARKRQPYARGMWLAGLITGYIGLGISLLWIAGIIVFIVVLASNPHAFSSGDYSLN
jgi:Domain of unknown function (DUF4190)